MSKSKIVPNNLAQLQSTLGYTFVDQENLVRALSHRSVGKDNNERIEFLGDSLLGLFIAEALFLKFPDADEGDLTRLRAHMVKGETLSELAREFKLGDYLILGGGELKSGGYRRDSILEDTVEALIGAIYLEAGMEQCKACTLSWYEARLASLTTEAIQKHAKTRLQEYMQRKKKPLPKYTVVEEMGDMHAREYRVECRVVFSDVPFVATASSRRIAERKSAEQALEYLESKQS